MSESLSRKNSSSSSTGAVGGRGSSNRKKFQFKNLVSDRGLVESLPILRHSSRMEDQMAVKFITWKEKLFQYVQNNGNYSAKVATIFKGRNPAAEWLPEPPDGHSRFMP
jgi:hypothetical protein